jgi:periplasmic protein TonB
VVSQSDAEVRTLAGYATDLWGIYHPDPYSWANSVLIHLFVVTALLLPFAMRQFGNNVQAPRDILEFTPVMLTFPHLNGKSDSTHGGGGGGDRTPLPASHGALPLFAQIQFTSPQVKVPPTTPLLPMPATLLGPPELKLAAMKPDEAFGDPLSQAQIASQGPGTGGGIGPGAGTGVGPSRGPGYGPGQDGGCCEGAYSVGSGVTAPVPIYSPEPAYSEEARKAKFTGNVTLWIVVDAQGIVRSVKVAKSLGMGLDEEAIKAVATWKFKPAMRQGNPVPVRAAVEVSFRLF